ncbi:hypothetical protein NONI108955_01460 [Nocardia ninae]|uniref:Uncharacterized protein n=1 Tax=Nocardia ninae NBRC 108245 TaxID=1210091 RepID=A0A511MDS3_9NOCA|nr:hypothetical protein [Nocardia ninae]GEM38248.1 hypothetical protein NN4_27670 [Nocardia ninae NBRC 108245]
MSGHIDIRVVLTVIETDSEGPALYEVRVNEWPCGRVARVPTGWRKVSEATGRTRGPFFDTAETAALALAGEWG